MQTKYIKIKKAQQNNLKSCDLNIPLGHLTVVCGLSGSGKSSLAFETLFAEGQRHYTQTLSHYSQQYIQKMAKPLVESITNIPPALAFQQKNTVRSSRPTVATLTELDHFLRLLFARSAQAICPKHKQTLKALSPQEGALAIQKQFPKGRGLVSFFIDIDKSGYSLLNLKKKLMKDGLNRIWLPKEKRTKTGFPVLHDLSVISHKQKKIHIVVDRLMFEDQERLRDSLKLANRLFLKYNKIFRVSSALVSAEGQQSFFLSETPSCPQCAYQFPFFPLPVSLFNFNSPLGACPTCKGFGHNMALDEAKVIPHPGKSIMEGALVPFTMPSASAELRQLKQFCRKNLIDPHCAWQNLPALHKKKIWKGGDGFIGVQGFFNDLESKKYKMHVRVFLSRYKSATPCVKCEGRRFRKELSDLFWKGKTIMDLFSMNIHAVRKLFQSLSVLEQKQNKDILYKITMILEGLHQMGLDYLQLDRPINTLSSGEFQRLNLANQIGLELSQVLYVLDEPTVGLHPKDSQRLIKLLKNLKSLGNTLVVVEHDPALINSADFIVEMGPKSGLQGGKVVFAGQRKDFGHCSDSQTSSYLKKSSARPIPTLPVDFKKHKYFLEITGCRAHNLKNISMRLPLNRLVTVTGVSGSGKSTLISQTLYPALAKALHGTAQKGHPFQSLKGAGYLKKVVWVDASRVNKHKTSFPITYLGIYSDIRKLMAFQCQKASLRQEITPQLFSLNVPGGRCPACRGMGYQEIEMFFMDPIRSVCEACQGQRFKKEILNLKWKDKNIAQILNMTVNLASDFFVSYPHIWAPLSFLKKVGLGYLLLGQSLATLSGGESQRLKLSRELRDHPKNTLYILDEPTVGLHFREVGLLISVLRNLIRQGSSVLLIEHNLEVMEQSDYIIDMGPGAGPQGGEIIAQGSPYELAHHPLSQTGAFLKG